MWYNQNTYLPRLENIEQQQTHRDFPSKAKKAKSRANSRKHNQKYALSPSATTI